MRQNNNVGLIFLSTSSIEDFSFQVEIAMLKLDFYFVLLYFYICQNDFLEEGLKFFLNM